MRLIEFLPRVEGPLVVELVEFLRAHEGLVCQMDWGEWDFVAVDEEGTEMLGIKSVRNHLPKTTVEQVFRSLIPYKVFLVEGESPDFTLLSAHASLLSSQGVGIYVRNYGWVGIPHFRPKRAAPVDKLMFAPAWSQNPEGRWEKRCSRCKQKKTPNEFPFRGKDARRDPYKNICKVCDNERRRQNSHHSH